MNEKVNEYLKAFDEKPMRERRQILRAKRQNEEIMSKIDGTLIEEVQLILDKKSTLCAADRQFVLLVVSHAVKQIEAEKKIKDAENKNQRATV